MGNNNNINNNNNNNNINKNTHTEEKEMRGIKELQQKTDKERNKRIKRKQQSIYNERQMRKTGRGKVEDRKRKRQKRIGYKKTEIKKNYASFREQIATKKGRKKTTELMFARYLCSRDILRRSK